MSLAADLGAPATAVAELPDDPSRAHWAAAFVSQTLNEIGALGLTAAEWIRLAASATPPDPEYIAGASAGLL